jgi:uncharacterized SAM-binding protein YcdF (DUF218 family)
MVLGAGKNNDPLRSENLRLSQEVLARLFEAVKRCKRLPEYTLVCSSPLVRGDKSQAVLLKETAVMLGIPPQHIQLIDQGVNTKTEAAQYVQKFGKHNPLILCTSALHMKRAKVWFYYHGLRNIYPAPPHYKAPHTAFLLDSCIPNMSSFFTWQEYLKEVLCTWMVPSV